MGWTMNSNAALRNTEQVKTRTIPLPRNCRGVISLIFGKKKQSGELRPFVRYWWLNPHVWCICFQLSDRAQKACAESWAGDGETCGSQVKQRLAWAIGVRGRGEAENDSPQAGVCGATASLQERTLPALNYQFQNVQKQKNPEKTSGSCLVEWTVLDSNKRPPRCQRGALTN